MKNIFIGFFSFIMFDFHNVYAFNYINKNEKKNSLIKMSYNNLDVSRDIKYIKEHKWLFNNDEYSNIIKNIEANEIKKIYVDNNFKQIVTVDNIPDSAFLPFSSHYHIADANVLLMPNIIDKATENHVSLNFVDFTPDSFLFVQNIFKQLGEFSNFIFPLFIGYIFLSAIIGILFQRPNGPGPGPGSGMNINMQRGNPFSILMPNNKEVFSKPNVSLASWAGSPEIIEECREIISYLENKKQYSLLGAEMPKGILLEGPPGTGKTLLAKAIATETNSSFFSISASEFIEVFVGVGASRVRDLFSSARKQNPSIIFIDEIDAIGRQRGAGVNMGNDEREQTLNQLLYEMDGFNTNENLVVIAATNRKDVLDQALLRPGRFDRIVRVPLPDKISREKILGYYLENKKLEKPFNISSIAEFTDGFSGAQLKNLINEAAILSVRNNHTLIQEKYVYDSFEKLIVGLIRSNATVSQNTKTRVSIHESGHTLLTLLFKEYFIFQKVSIQPTYNGAGGYTIFSETQDVKEGGLYTKDLLKKRLIVAMGGKAAESIFYGNEFVSLGAIQDLKQANGIAKKMIGNFGMGDKLEVFFNEDIDDGANPFLGKSMAFGEKYSEYTKSVMDKESLELVKNAYSEAKDLLQKNWDKVLFISDLLKNNTILYEKDLTGMLQYDL
jgi:cell division protease FtsH